MDRWLTSSLKGLLHQPCLATARYIGEKLENRIRTGQEIGETALTEEFVDAFRPASHFSLWRDVAQRIRDEFGLYLNLNVDKSTIEPKTGTDIGLVVRRSVYQKSPSRAEYAVLIQCKKIDQKGSVDDFFHVVSGSGRRQSELMLSITPCSYYFLYVPPSLLSGYLNVESIGFVQAGQDCHVPIWNIGAMPMPSIQTRALETGELTLAASILVVPALAVAAQQNSSKAAKLEDLLPNALPFWYWFAELLIPGFIGDVDSRVIEVATNTRTRELDRPDFGVRYSISVGVANG